MVLDPLHSKKQIHAVERKKADKIGKKESTHRLPAPWPATPVRILPRLQFPAVAPSPAAVAVATAAAAAAAAAAGRRPPAEETERGMGLDT